MRLHPRPPVVDVSTTHLFAVNIMQTIFEQLDMTFTLGGQTGNSPNSSASNKNKYSLQFISKPTNFFQYPKVGKFLNNLEIIKNLKNDKKFKNDNKL